MNLNLDCTLRRMCPLRWRRMLSRHQLQIQSYRPRTRKERRPAPAVSEQVGDEGRPDSLMASDGLPGSAGTGLAAPWLVWTPPGPGWHRGMAAPGLETLTPCSRGVGSLHTLTS